MRATYELRYEGQAFELPVDGDPRPDPADLRRAFDRAHEDRYGYSRPGRGPRARHDPRGRSRCPARSRAPGRVGRAAGGAGRGAGVVALPGSTLVIPDGLARRAPSADLVVMER